MLANRPVGHITDDVFKTIGQDPVPQPKEGEILLRNLWLSLDPAMRGWLNDVRSYIPPVKIGEVMRGSTVAQVISSNNSKFPVGTLVAGTGGWQEYCVTNGKGWMALPYPPYPSSSLWASNPFNSPTLYLGVLGMTGMTAYFGLIDVGKPKAGETVLVSAAAGAVGSIVGQIAKIKGCFVVGLAGTDEKCRWLTSSLGFDGAINYKGKDVNQLNAAIRGACPKGVDIYFDNVGGATLDAALARLNRGGRVAICGAISQYNATEKVPGPSNYMSLLVNRARMEGFVVLDYYRQFPAAMAEIKKWIAEGKIQFSEHIVEGLQSAPKALNLLFNGDHSGKLIVHIANPVAAPASSAPHPARL